MKRWQILTFAVVCFGVGALSATVYEGIAQGGSHSRRGALYDGLAERLNLTQEQQVRLNEIVEEARQSMVTLSQETRPRFRTIKQETRNRVREILNPEQLVTFNAICESCDRRKTRN